MQKTSQFYLLLMLAAAFILFYEAFFPLPSTFTIQRAMGLIALFLLAVSVMLGPLIQFRPKMFVALLESRRALGLSAFTFMAGHFLLVLIQNLNGNIAPIFQYVQLGIAAPALLIFLALALTSTDWAVRTLGKTWKTLHRLIYVGFALALGHFYMNMTGVIDPTAPWGLSTHFGELLVWATAGAAIVLQLAGFWVARTKKKENPPAPAETPKS